MTGPDDGYLGPAVLHLDGRALPVRARLGARHEPVDGRMRWFGRVATADAEVLRVAITQAVRDVELETPTGRAPATVGDPDSWGRYRVAGTGAPPYRDDPCDGAGAPVS